MVSIEAAVDPARGRVSHEVFSEVIQRAFCRYWSERMNGDG